MTYKTILLHLHDPRRAHRLLSVALPIARKMDAHLLAINVLPPYVVLPGGEVGGAQTVDAHREEYRADIATLKDMFNEATRLNAAKAEWLEVDANFGSAAGLLIKYGRPCDLIITSQKDPSWTLTDFLEEPERVAMEAGRPVLIVPNKGTLNSPPKRVTIAWNGRREAVRAVFDAIPLMKGADEVNIVWIYPARETARGGDIPGSDLATALDRHGLKCTVSTSHAGEGEIGSELLRQAAAFGSDLLVMGVYGHSRFREFVLGGASRDILAGMDRPVLLSH